MKRKIILHIFIVNKEKIKAPSNVDEETLAGELTWPQHNLKILDEISK